MMQLRSEQRACIKKFQDELRNEEAKLVLLKKIRLSQCRKVSETVSFNVFFICMHRNIEVHVISGGSALFFYFSICSAR